MERQDTGSNYLIYAPFPKPPVAENHLEDTLLYSKRFYADRWNSQKVRRMLSNEKYKGDAFYGLLNEPVFKKLGEKYGKTSAQVILRWHTQMGFVVIPGSKSTAHIKDNFEIFDFTLTDSEMNEIAKINKNKRYYNRTDEQLEVFAGWQPKYEEQ